MFDQLFPHGLAVYLTGGLFIGLGVALLYVATGRPGGISTFYSAAWSWCIDSRFFRQAALLDGRRWRLVYALGLLLGGFAYAQFGLPLTPSSLPAWKLALGGLLIGFGARLGGGCTSGHGICGIASLSGGSLLMVVTFLATAIAVAHAVSFLGI